MSESQQNFPGVRELQVGAESVGQRIDNYLLKHLKGVPRSHVYRILRTGEVRVNRGRIRASYRLQDGDRVRVPPIRLAQRDKPAVPRGRLVETLPERVLFQDNDLMVIDKPAGMAVHGGSGLSWGLIEALRALLPEQRYLELVHRLDRETSGCLLIARRRSALRSLHEQLRNNQIGKRYTALLAGSLEYDRKTVEVPLLKNVLKSGERMVRPHPEGKSARTEFRAIERYRSATLVEARPVTGRTHQIRVHAAYLGHPVCGDDKYGDEQVNRDLRRLGLTRLFLHATSLEFRSPGEGHRITVEAQLSPALGELRRRLRK